MPLRPDIPGVSRLKAILAGHGYLGPEALAALGGPLAGAHRRVDLPVYLRRLPPGAPLSALVRLFGLFAPVGEREAREAVAPIELDEVEAMGLVARRGREVQARCGLTAFDGLLLAHDRVDEQDPRLESDHVLGVNPTTVNLSQLTVRRRVRSALDVGCGNGVQALLAARHAERVTGIDKNPRALAFARFNARLNGAENVEWLEGDFFAPVAGRRFDLVVSNPPYVISPETRYAFRDAGRAGDAASAEAVAGAAAHLEVGGHATVLCNWAMAQGEGWAAPPRRWTTAAGCDALALYRGSQDALDYAAYWNRSRDRAAYEEALDRWTGHFRELRIASVGLGAIVLRRQEGRAASFGAVELPDRPQGPAGEQILRMLAAQDVLAEGGEEALLGRPWRVAPRLRVDQRLAPVEGGWGTEEARLVLDEGIRFEGLVDAHTLELLRLCDGRRTLGEAVAELCRPGGPARDSVLEVARHLCTLGFLTVNDRMETGERS